LLPLTSFLALYLIYAFAVGQAPDYSRMLIILPFVAYLVAEAVRAVAATRPLAALTSRPPGCRTQSIERRPTPRLKPSSSRLACHDPDNTTRRFTGLCHLTPEHVDGLSDRAAQNVV
jgi:hypothetical protein